MVRMSMVKRKVTNLLLASTGFSLVEVLVVVVIIGIISGIAIPSFSFVLRRERVNAVALDIAGWLEEARSISAREVRTEVIQDAVAERSQGGCSISLNSSLSNAAEGAQIASVTGCASRNASLLIPAVQGSRFNIAVFSGAGASQTGSLDLYFTPRGMWSSETPELQNQDLEIRIVLADGQGPKRCVRVSSILGSIDIGTSSSGDLSSSCTNYGSI
jgi:prepilin-type N-terminal cleavage/methylation domain-containing protein